MRMLFCFAHEWPTCHALGGVSRHHLLAGRTTPLRNYAESRGTARTSDYLPSWANSLNWLDLDKFKQYRLPTRIVQNLHPFIACLFNTGLHLDRLPAPCGRVGASTQVLEYTNSRCSGVP
jgi:hypothetical protein